MKIRRGKIEARFSEIAMDLAHRSTVEGMLIVHRWER